MACIRNLNGHLRNFLLIGYGNQAVGVGLNFGGVAVKLLFDNGISVVDSVVVLLRQIFNGEFCLGRGQILIVDERFLIGRGREALYTSRVINSGRFVAFLSCHSFLTLSSTTFFMPKLTVPLEPMPPPRFAELLWAMVTFASFLGIGVCFNGRVELRVLIGVALGQMRAVVLDCSREIA